MEHSRELRKRPHRERLIFDKGAKATQLNNDNLFSKRHWKRSVKNTPSLDTDFTPFTRINSEWTKDLNVKCKTMKLLEDSKGENLMDVGYAGAFLGTVPKAQPVKERRVSSA